MYNQLTYQPKTRVQQKLLQQKQKIIAHLKEGRFSPVHDISHQTTTFPKTDWDNSEWAWIYGKFDLLVRMLDGVHFAIVHMTI